MSERLGRDVLSLSKQKWEQLPDGKRLRRAGSSDNEYAVKHAKEYDR